MQKIKYILISIIVIILIPIVFIIYFLENSIGIKTALHLTKMFIFTPSEYVSEYDGRTNILILGKSENLTDTIIFVSIPHQKNKPISLISIPRDLWIDSYKTKINSLYYFGGQKLVNSAIEEMFNTKIQYTLILGFEDFVKIIDLMDGINVNIEHSFVDEKYPILGKENDLCDGDLEYKCRYETISFEKGFQKMDGATALKYVRSRKSVDIDEGTDIARSKRQREVMNAVVAKFFSKEILLNSKKVGQIYSTIWSLFETNLSPSSSAILARRVFDKRHLINSLSIPEKFLETHINEKRYDNLYVFVFVDSSLLELQTWFYKNVLQREF